MVRGPTGDVWVRSLGGPTTEVVIRSDGFLRSSFERTSREVVRVGLGDLLDCSLPERNRFGQIFLTFSSGVQIYISVVNFRCS